MLLTYFFHVSWERERSLHIADNWLTTWARLRKSEQQLFFFYGHFYKLSKTRMVKRTVTGCVLQQCSSTNAKYARMTKPPIPLWIHCTLVVVSVCRRVKKCDTFYTPSFHFIFKYTYYHYNERKYLYKTTFFLSLLVSTSTGRYKPV